MNIFNKTEAVGIFVSIAVMAIALAVVRFETDKFTLKNNSLETQGAVVALSTGTMESTPERDEALYNSFTTGGTLVELITDDIKIGTGKEVKEGSSVTVHYEGKLKDGSRFDSSYERGTPYTFTIGNGTVIEGWEKGLLGMREGGQRVLVIPSEMAYGNRQVGPIPANSNLVFSVELLEVN